MHDMLRSFSEENISELFLGLFNIKSTSVRYIFNILIDLIWLSELVVVNITTMPSHFKIVLRIYTMLLTFKYNQSLCELVIFK